MKKLMVMVVVALSFVGLCSTAFADSSSEGKIGRLAVFDAGYTYIYKSGGGDWGTESGCNNTMSRFNTTTEAGKSLLKTALAARLANKNVKVYVNGCVGGTGHTLIYRIDIME